MEAEFYNSTTTEGEKDYCWFSAGDDIEEPKFVQYLPQHLPEMIDGIKSMDTTLQLKSVTRFRKLLSMSERNRAPIQEVIDCGIVPYLVHLLKRYDLPEIQYKAAWVLTNIASGTSEHTRVVIQHGAVPLFCILLSSSNAYVREQSIWALGNIAGASYYCRDLVLKSGALLPLIQQLNFNSSNTAAIRNAAWTLSNFCRGKPPQPHFEFVRDVLPTLANLLFLQDEEVLSLACLSLCYLSEDAQDAVSQNIIHSGICNQIFQLTSHSSPRVKSLALKIMTNLNLNTRQQEQDSTDSIKAAMESLMIHP